MNIIKLVKDAKLPVGEYIVVGSGTMAALGIRDAGDIDLVISAGLYQKLKQTGWEEVDKGEYKVLYNDLFEAGLCWDSVNEIPNLDELKKDAVMIDGVAFASLGRVREWKLKMRRLKDIKDVLLIDKYLEQSQSVAGS